MEAQCTYCDRKTRNKYTFCPFVPAGYESIACDRMWCKFKRGDTAWMKWLRRKTPWLHGLLRYRVKVEIYQTTQTKIRVRRITR